MERNYGVRIWSDFNMDLITARIGPSRHVTLKLESSTGLRAEFGKALIKLKADGRVTMLENNAIRSPLGPTLSQQTAMAEAQRPCQIGKDALLDSHGEFEVKYSHNGDRDTKTVSLSSPRFEFHSNISHTANDSLTIIL